MYNLSMAHPEIDHLTIYTGPKKQQTTFLIEPRYFSEKVLKRIINTSIDSPTPNMLTAIKDDLLCISITQDHFAEAKKLPRGRRRQVVKGIVDVIKYADSLTIVRQTYPQNI